MSLKDKIESDYNNSIKEKDSNSINTLRLIKSAIKDKEISLRGKQDSLTDSDILSLLQTLVKQKKDWIGLINNAGLFKYDTGETFHSKNLNKRLMWLPSSLNLKKKDLLKICKEINKFYS